MTIKSVNDIAVATTGTVTVTMTEENAIRMLHFANFGEETMDAIYETYKGNKQDLDLKMDNLADLKEQLGLKDAQGRYLKVSNLVVN